MVGTEVVIEIRQPVLLDNFRVFVSLNALSAKPTSRVQRVEIISPINISPRPFLVNVHVCLGLPDS